MECNYSTRLPFHLLACLSITVNLIGQDVIPSVQDAIQHCEIEFNKAHQKTYVYKDLNFAGNHFHPHVEGDTNIIVLPAQRDNPAAGSTYQTVIFPLSDTAQTFSIWRFTAPENNFGQYPGIDLSQGDGNLTFHLRGKGKIDVQAFGVNRRPFHNPDFPYQDGADIRTIGTIELTEEWKKWTLDLREDTIVWVFKDPLAGYYNQFPKVAVMGANGGHFSFNMNADDGEGNTCISAYWNFHVSIGGFWLTCFLEFPPRTCWEGIYLFPPEGDWSGTQGINLAGIKSIRFKAKSNKDCSIKFLFGKNGDDCREEIVTSIGQEWKWYNWNLKKATDCNNIVGGFGFIGDENLTPDGTRIFIDSIHYVGPSLASDFSQAIGGFSVVASQAFNQDTVTVHLDEVFFDAPRLDELRLSQSFVTTDHLVDISQQMSAHTYDNALLLIAYLSMYGATEEEKYLNYARIIGDAFLYAMKHDRFYNDGRLRNVYSAGDLVNRKDGASRIAGWWDHVTERWEEDKYFHGSSTGNMAWAGTALTSLFEVTKDRQYLEGAETLARWCIDNTQTNFGYTGGMEGWEGNQENVSWKSTEHNIDLYSLFFRLYCLAGATYYKDAYINAENFVRSMWNEKSQCFWTGTGSDGVTINSSTIPLDIQPWYIQAFQDISSKYKSGIDWALANCFLENYQSPNYEQPLNGLDFNDDRDGIWFEGTAQVALALKMLGRYDLAESLLATIRYTQKNGPNNNGLGIVAADHDHLSTGFNWEYHNRLHIGATCWYIFAQLGVNPYYCPIPDCEVEYTIDWKNKEDEVLIGGLFPNPFSDYTTFEFRLPENAEVDLKIFDMSGRLIRTLVDGQLDTHFYQIHWDGKDQSGHEASQGVYISTLRIDGILTTRKLVLVR